MPRDASTTYVTLGGLPLRIELEWPFHPSQSGADWFSLHGRVWLDDGGASLLHADVAVNLTQTIKEALPSLAPEHAGPVVINALRKEFDVYQLELLKSGKRQPVPVSSRHFNFKTRQLVFAKATEPQMVELLRRKTYWTAARHGARARSWMADPYDALYCNATAGQLLAAARKLQGEGLLELEGEHAEASGALLLLKDAMEAEMHAALAALEAKHAFERA
jgi:hypothetical protein